MNEKEKWFEEGYKAGVNDVLLECHKLLPPKSGLSYPDSDFTKEIVRPNGCYCSDYNPKCDWCKEQNKEPKGCGKMFKYNNIGLRCGEKYTVGESASFCPKCQEESKAVPEEEKWGKSKYKNDLCKCGHSRFRHELFSQGRKGARYCVHCDCNEFVEVSEGVTEDKE